MEVYGFDSRWTLEHLLFDFETQWHLKSIFDYTWQQLVLYIGCSCYYTSQDFVKWKPHYNSYNPNLTTSTTPPISNPYPFSHSSASLSPQSESSADQMAGTPGFSSSTPPKGLKSLLWYCVADNSLRILATVLPLKSIMPAVKQSALGGRSSQITTLSSTEKIHQPAIQ